MDAIWPVTRLAIGPAADWLLATGHQPGRLGECNPASGGGHDMTD